MKHNYQQISAVFIFLVVFACPVSICAQEASINDSVSIENTSGQKWYSYLWQHLQLTGNIGYNMYGDNAINSCINHLGHDDANYAMSGVKLSLAVKYNAFKRGQWNIYAGVGCALYNQHFKSAFVSLDEEGAVGTFKRIECSSDIAKLESKQPADFGLKHKDWESSFSAFYVTLPISATYDAKNIEIGVTILPSIRIGNSSLRRDISIGNADEIEVLYQSTDKNLDRHINKFACQLRLSCLYKGMVGGYVEFGTVSMTQNLKYETYSFSVGAQFQLTRKSL